MRSELRDFVVDRGLSVFGDDVSSVKSSKLFQTKDGKSVYLKVLRKLSDFVFGSSFGVWSYFGLDLSDAEILKRQEFWKKVSSGRLCDSKVLGKLKVPRKSWTPKYDVVVVTESEESFVRLNSLSCGVILLSNENDVADLERYDIVQCVDVADFRGILERLPQSVFLDSVEDVYLERFLEILSGWRENFAVLNGADVSRELRDCLDELIEPFALLENKEGRVLTEGEVERALEEINEDVGEKIKGRMISGADMMRMLGEGKMSEDLLEIVRSAIEETGLPESIFNIGIPVSIDYKELEEQIRLQSTNEYTDVAERIKRNASRLKGIPEILEKLEAEILIEDFCCGISKYLGDGKMEPRITRIDTNLKVDRIESQKNAEGRRENEKMRWPEISKELLMEDCENLFLRVPQAISFILDNEARGSILTGANSGGKTTLLEHVLQNVVLMKLGLSVVGSFRSPNFDDVYYFAKTKGSTSKGAFETLLTQMASIFDAEGRRSRQAEGRVLILADEIEAVTEPGVAGKIISSTAEYFVRKGAYVVMATHLGAEIAKNLSEGLRVDGIEAKGLDEDFNLIVNHNPVLGRLASSTPELIVERMKNSVGGDYFEFLFGKMKGG